MDENKSVRYIAQFFNEETLGWYSYGSFPEFNHIAAAKEWAKGQEEQKDEVSRILCITREVVP